MSRDPVVRAFWQNEYAGYCESFRAEAISPIQNKIGKALMIPRLRNMLAQPKSTITLRRLMDEGAIVICNLSKGALRREHCAPARARSSPPPFSQAALSRADTPAGRAPHLPPLCRRVPILRHRELFAHSLRGAQVRPDAHDRAPVPRTASRPAARRHIRQRRIDHRLPRRSRGRRDPCRQIGLGGQRRCLTCQLHRLGAAIARRRPRPPRSASTSMTPPAPADTMRTGSSTQAACASAGRARKSKSGSAASWGWRR